MTRDELEAKVERQAGQIEQLLVLCQDLLDREARTLELVKELGDQVRELRDGETHDDLDDADWWKE